MNNGNPDYNTYNKRLSTFPIPNRLAKNAAMAGFYYHDTYQELLCYCCYMTVKNYLDSDILMAEHALSNPQCSYVKIMCSPEFMAHLVHYQSRYRYFDSAPSFIIYRPNQAILGLYSAKERPAVQQCQIQKIPLSQFPHMMALLAPLMHVEIDVSTHDQDACIVCTINKRCVVMFPCKHLTVCKVCIFEMISCPYCQGPIESVLSVYY